MTATYRQVDFGNDPVQDFIPVGNNSLPAISVCVDLGDSIGTDFIIHPKGRSGFVHISVRKMDPEIIIRAIEAAIGQPVALAVDQSARQ